MKRFGSRAILAGLALTLVLPTLTGCATPTAVIAQDESAPIQTDRLKYTLRSDGLGYQATIR